MIDSGAGPREAAGRNRVDGVVDAVRWVRRQIAGASCLGGGGGFSVCVRDRLKTFFTRESVLLVTLLVMAAACWGFVELADEMREGDTRAVDEQLLLLFREPGNPERLRGPADMEMVVRDITALGGAAVLTLFTLGVAGFFILRRQWPALSLMLVTVVGGTLLVDSLKNVFARERPTILAHLMEETSYSFPSGHSTMATVVYLSLAVMLAEFQNKRRVRIYIIAFAALLAVLIGVSRVVLGVHYPSDVAAGWTLGISWAALTWIVAKRLKKRRPALEQSATRED